MDTKVLALLAEAGFEPPALEALAAADVQAAESPTWRRQLTRPLVGVPESKSDTFTEPLARAAGECGLHPYTLHLLYLAKNLPSLEAECAARSYDPDVARGVGRELHSKTTECREMYGLWGTSCLDFHLPFFFLWRFVLGRLQYEPRVYNETECQIGPYTIKPGDAIHGMHIPSGGSFSREARLDSYRRAFRFYGCTRENPLVVHCSSWLLNPDHEWMLPVSSNIVGFLHDFTPVGATEREGFPDAWRVFGRASERPLAEWPADTALRRAYVELLRSGRNAKNGRGLLVFDGEEVVSGPQR